MAALWDIVGKASNLFQLLGLEAITFVTIAISFLRFRESKKEYRKLEDRVRLLRMLMSSPAGWWIMTQQQYLELGDLVISAHSTLRDAQCLVASYNESTLFLLVRRGRSMARQFQDLRSRIDYYCGLIHTVNACLLMVQANPGPPPPSVVRSEVNIGDVPPLTGHSTEAQVSATAVPVHDTRHIISVIHE